MTLAQLAAEIGRSEHHTKKLLDKLEFAGLRPRPGCITAYEVHDLEALKALLGQPHSKTDSGQTDWLSDYLGGTQHG